MIGDNVPKSFIPVPVLWSQTVENIFWVQENQINLQLKSGLCCYYFRKIGSASFADHLGYFSSKRIKKKSCVVSRSVIKLHCMLVDSICSLFVARKSFNKPFLWQFRKKAFLLLKHCGYFKQFSELISINFPNRQQLAMDHAINCFDLEFLSWFWITLKQTS